MYEAFKIPNDIADITLNIPSCSIDHSLTWSFNSIVLNVFYERADLDDMM